MASTITRRPLPALVALLALLLLTALVWWRVTNRDAEGAPKAEKTCPVTAAPASAPTTLPPQSAVDVAVLNASTKTGLAGKVRDALLADGFKSSQRAANDTSDYKVSGTAQIRYTADKKSAAGLLHYYFPDAQLMQITATAPQVTVSLGPKYAGIEDQKAVTAKLATDKVTLSTAAPTAAPSATPTC